MCVVRQIRKTLRDLGLILLIAYFMFTQIESSNGKTWRASSNEYFSSAKEMEKLYNTEELLISTLENIISEKKRIITLLERDLEEYKKWHANSSADEYVKNPICVFTIIKRLLYDWKKTKAISPNSWSSFGNLSSHLPSATDLAGAAESIFIIQLTYQIKTKDFANGIIEENRLPHSMSGSDCLVLAKELYKLEYYTLSEGWLMEALLQYEEGAPEILTVLEYLTLSTCKIGNRDVAEMYLKILTAIEPRVDHVRLEEFEKYSNIIKENKCVQEEAEKHNIEYLKLCRVQEKLKGDTVKLRNYSCHYIDDNPFLKIAPLKMEELSHDPPIRYYHNVISDKEIQTLQHTTKHGMIRATVKGNKVISERRSMLRWIYDEELQAINLSYLNSRIKDMTGLSLVKSEFLQLNNYGPGGEYKPHCDNFAQKQYDDRVTTVMFYLSDVEYGGATVFTTLGLRVHPIKGDALVWNNVLDDGTKDERLIHTGCPVGVGSKWVLNKWIHYLGETFTWPCKIKEDKKNLQNINTEN